MHLVQSSVVHEYFWENESLISSLSAQIAPVLGALLSDETKSLWNNSFWHQVVHYEREKTSLSINIATLDIHTKIQWIKPIMLFAP